MPKSAAPNFALETSKMKTMAQQENLSVRKRSNIDQLNAALAERKS